MLFHSIDCAHQLHAPIDGSDICHIKAPGSLDHGISPVSTSASDTEILDAPFEILLQLNILSQSSWNV